MKNRFVGTGLVLAALVAPWPLAADDIPPPGSKSMLAIVKELEGTQYAPIVDVSYDDGLWEVEAYSQDIPYELTIDPSTGNILAKHRDEPSTLPPPNALQLSEILSRLEQAGFTSISDVSFEYQSWEVEALRDQQKRELRVDPLTGEIISDRVDD